MDKIESLAHLPDGMIGRVSSGTALLTGEAAAMPEATKDAIRAACRSVSEAVYEDQEYKDGCLHTVELVLKGIGDKPR